LALIRILTRQSGARLSKSWAHCLQEDHSLNDRQLLPLNIKGAPPTVLWTRKGGGISEGSRWSNWSLDVRRERPGVSADQILDRRLDLHPGELSFGTAGSNRDL